MRNRHDARWVVPIVLFLAMGSFVALIPWIRLGDVSHPSTAEIKPTPASIAMFGDSLPSAVLPFAHVSDDKEEEEIAQHFLRRMEETSTLRSDGGSNSLEDVSISKEIKSLGSISQVANNTTARNRLSTLLDKFDGFVQNREFILFQVDNRAYPIFQGRPYKKGNFTSSVFGPSTLSMSRWAKQNNYAYILNLSPLPFLDAEGKRGVTFFWQKVPPFIILMRLALLSNARKLQNGNVRLVKGIVFADSDVFPQSYLPKWRYEQNGTCTPRIIPFKSASPEHQSIALNLDEFLEEMPKPLAHVFVARGHSSSESWLRESCKYPRWFTLPDGVTKQAIPSVNGGMMLFRTTETSLSILREWYLKAADKTPLEEHSRKFYYRSEGGVSLSSSSLEIESPATVVKRWMNGLLATNRRRALQGSPIYHQELPGKNADLISDAVCSPSIVKQDRTLKTRNGPMTLYRFTCRGVDSKVVQKAIDELCGQKVDERVVCVEKNSKKYIEKTFLDYWPAEQGRLQWMLLRSIARGEGNSVFHLGEQVALSTPALVFRSPAENGPQRRVFYHIATNRDMKETSDAVSRILLQETQPDRCVLDVQGWETEAWDEFKKLPAFQLSFEHSFVHIESTLFDESSAGQDETTVNNNNAELISWFNLP